MYDNSACLIFWAVCNVSSRASELHGSLAHIGMLKNFLGTRQSQLSQFFFYSFCPNSAPTSWRMWVCIHVSDCVEFEYGLPLLPNNTASETFLHRSRALRSVAMTFFTGAQAWWLLGDYMTLDKRLYNFLSKQEVSATQVTSTFASLSHSSKRPLLEIK